MSSAAGHKDDKPSSDVEGQYSPEKTPPSSDSALDAQFDERKLTCAILAFPSSFAILGMAGGVIATLLIGLATMWTSHVLWRYCMAHPQIRDICDAAYCLTGSRWGWWAAFIGLALNNYCIMGLHVNAGGTAIQTIRGGQECTLVWGIILAVIMFVGSTVRDFRHMSMIGLVASSTMLICTLVVLVGHGVQGNPNLWTPDNPVTWGLWAPEGTTFISGLNAVLNWVGQALIPSFVGDMKHPEDFPKALYVSMAAEFCLFTITGSVVYAYAGTSYTTAPAYGSLIEKYGKIAAGLTMPTSWSTWMVIVFGGWVISFLIGEAVPFFNNLLALITSFFDSWFGFIFWSAAWYELNKGKRLAGPYQIAENVVAALMMITGIFFFAAGTYTSIQSIVNSYATGTGIKAPFSCANSGFPFVVYDPTSEAM
ncbi:hypothetical protein RQP46_009447 [Phenoliferia psychrophenolica]